MTFLGPVAAVLFGIAVFVCAGAVQRMFRERRDVVRTLAAVRRLDEPVRPASADAAPGALARTVVPAMLQVGEVAKRLIPLSSVKRIDRTLAYAGSPSGWDAERVLAAKLIGTAMGALVSFVITAGMRR